MEKCSYARYRLVIFAQLEFVCAHLEAYSNPPYVNVKDNSNTTGNPCNGMLITDTVVVVILFRPNRYVISPTIAKCVVVRRHGHIQGPAVPF